MKNKTYKTLRELNFQRNEFLCPPLTEKDWEKILSQTEPFALNLEQVHLTDDDLRRLENHPYLYSLNLANVELTARAIESLGKIPSLRHLNLESADEAMTDQTIEFLRPLEHLESLTVSWCENLTDKAMEVIRTFKNLRELDLYRCVKLTHKGLTSLTELTQLETLDIGSTKCSNKTLALLPVLEKLKSLNILETKITPRGLAPLTELPLLETLDLSHNTIAAGLDCLRSIPRLRRLSLSRTDIRDADLACLEPLEKLIALHLNDSQIDGSGLQHLTCGKNLLELSLFRSCKLRDKYLAALEQLTRLEILDLASSEKITDKGLVHLEPLQRLQELHIRNLPSVKGPGLAALRLLTNLRVLYADYLMVTDSSMSFLRSLVRLKILDLSYSNRLTDLSLKFMSNLTCLARLDLRNTQIRGTGLVHLAGLKKLKDLCLAETPLEELPVLPQLETLTLNSCRMITDTMLASLTGIPRLRNLELLNCPQITNETLKTISRLRLLEFLELRKTPITNEGLSFLTGLKKLVRLETDE